MVLGWMAQIASGFTMQMLFRSRFEQVQVFKQVVHECEMIFKSFSEKSFSCGQKLLQDLTVPK
jgi:hypothetical protein